MGEARMFIEAMNQKMATGMFYGNPATDPKEFLGLAPRYSSLGAGNGQNVISASSEAGSTKTSAWLTCWSDQTVFCPFPKGSNAGLLQEDLGRQTSFDVVGGASGTRMEVFAERFQWKSGLVVKDWRYAVRIANIETDGGTDSITVLDTKMSAGNVNNLLHLMTKAIARIPNTSMGRMVFYMNRTVFTGLMRLALEKSSSALSISDAVTQFGTNQSMLSFLGIPIRQCDAIINTEAVVA
jgi:hypothetical protein